MRNSTKALTALAAVLLTIPFTEAVAQRRRGLYEVRHDSERHGFWINFGLAAGAENFRFANESGCHGSIGTYQRCDELFKPSLSIALGGTINPQVRLGGEINAWVYEHHNQDFGNVTSYLVGGLMTAQVYPVRQLGLFVKGGAGISRSGEEFSYAQGVGETGFAYLLGAGYEIKLARNFFLTPNLNLMHHVSGTAEGDDPTHAGTFHERVVTIGVGLTYQPGR